MNKKILWIIIQISSVYTMNSPYRNREPYFSPRRANPELQKPRTLFDRLKQDPEIGKEISKFSELFNKDNTVVLWDRPNNEVRKYLIGPKNSVELKNNLVILQYQIYRFSIESQGYIYEIKNVKNVSGDILQIVTDYSGLSLYELFFKTNPLLVEIIQLEVYRKIPFLYKALKVLHSKGICHLDIKPENICYNIETKEIKFIDFDLAELNERRKIVYSGTFIYFSPFVIYNMINKHETALKIHDETLFFLTIVSIFNKDMYQEVYEGFIQKHIKDKYKSFIIQDGVEGLMKIIKMENIEPSLINTPEKLLAALKRYVWNEIMLMLNNNVDKRLILKLKSRIYELDRILKKLRTEVYTYNSASAGVEANKQDLFEEENNYVF